MDRRTTDLGSTFYQGVVGGEILAEDFDVRLNGYLPFNDKKTHMTANTGRITPYLAGSGIFYDTAGIVTEEAQPGFDLELGVRVPAFEEQVDSIRVYGGIYHFEGDKTDNVSGFRTRLSTEITEDLQLGMRYQRDDVRGSQTFLEATVRFPFGNKKSFRKDGLKSRLDESPERDIDIVTATKQTDTGMAKPLLVGPEGADGAAGTIQRVLHVNNTAAANGNGTLETPYNDLKLAEAQLRDNDILYIHHGDGTTTRQDQGLIINKANVSVIGSGSDFVFSSNRFSTGNSASDGQYQGTVLIAKTSAPIITNTDASDGTSGTITGNGIYSLYADTFISGVTVSGAQGNGIYIDAENANSKKIITVENTRIESSGAQGLRIVAFDAPSLDEVRISNVIAEYNSSTGITIQGKVTDSYISDSQSNYSTTGTGFNFTLGAISPTMNNIYLSRLEAHHNGAAGYGFTLASGAAGVINNIYMNNTNASYNPNGFSLDTASTAPLSVSSLSIEDSDFSNNGRGLYMNVRGASVFGSANFNRLKLDNNTEDGLQINTRNTSRINGPITISNTSFTNNTRYGIYLNDDVNPNNQMSMLVNLGDGTAGSGYNTILGNGTNDMLLDLDGGTVQAQYNWWGQAGGPAAGRIANEGACPACGTAITINALSGAP